MSLSSVLHIRLPGRCLAVGSVVFLLAACADPSSPPASLSVFEGIPHEVYECAPSDTTAFHVALHDDGDTRAVLLPGRFAPQVRSVRRVPTDHGATFKGSDFVLRTKAGEAFVDVNGRSFRNCLRVLGSPSADSPLVPTFRATGQEPGWSLTFFPDRFWFVGNYGRRPLAFPHSEPPGEAPAFHTTYQSYTRGHTLRVVLEDTTCTDTMSGEEFPYAVSVTLNDTTHTGCGAPLPQR